MVRSKNTEPTSQWNSVTRFRRAESTRNVWVECPAREDDDRSLAWTVRAWRCMYWDMLSPETRTFTSWSAITCRTDYVTRRGDV